MSLVSDEIKTGERPSNFANEDIEFQCITDAFDEPTSNGSPVVVLKEEPKNKFALKNTKRQRRSTTKNPITKSSEINDIKYEDISDLIALQVSLKQEEINCPSVIFEYYSIEQDVEVISSLENIKQPGSLRKRRVSPHSTLTSDSSRNVESDSVGEYSITNSKRLSLTTEQASNVNRLHKCKQCDKAFIGKMYLIRHELTHLDDQSFQCLLCPKTFTSETIFQQHTRAHSNEKMFPCDLCEKSFKHNFLLVRHQAVHSDDRPFQCKQCKKPFKSKRELIRHELTHSDTRPLQCLVCKKRFSNKKTLGKHATVHSNEKSYPCDLCEKSFKNKTHLFQHQAVHSDERPFPCNQCKKSFKSKTNLLQHQAVHKDDRPFQCKQCEKSFKSNNKLTRHQQIH